MTSADPCKTCGFDLWNPIAKTPALLVSDIALYDDARFPGRSILRLQQHEENLEQLETKLAFDFMKDIQTAIHALRVATGSERINVSILGNSVPHIHAHLIPRFAANEELPGKSPWDDPRVKTSLAEPQRIHLMSLIEALLQTPATKSTLLL